MVKTTKLQDSELLTPSLNQTQTGTVDAALAEAVSLPSALSLERVWWSTSTLALEEARWKKERALASRDLSWMKLLHSCLTLRPDTPLARSITNQKRSPENEVRKAETLA